MRKSKTNDEYIRERAELAGVELSDEALAAISGKWESDPLCNLDDLLVGVRNMQDHEQTKAAEAFAERAWSGNS